MTPLNLSGIPEELKRTHRWVMWQLEDVQDGEKLRKNMKPPYDAKTGERAKHNDFSTWTTYDVAVAAHESNLRLRTPSTTLAVYPTRGLGCVLGKPFFGIDLDDVRDPVTGVIEPEAMEWVREANTFTEVSPSGRGLHLWGHGEPPYEQGHRKDGREIYSMNRYLTVTGAVLEGYEEIRRFAPAEVKEWYNRIKNYGKEEPKGEAYKVKTPATTSAKIAELMVRTDYPDLSPMVQSLLTLLAIEHLLDPVKIEEEFKKSAFYTSTHWKEKFDRLGAKEIEKAIGFARENLQKRKEQQRGAQATAIRKPKLRQARGAKRKALTFMWDPVLPMGKLCHFGGASSQGKSPVTMDIIARTTTGADWPDGQKNTLGPRRVLLFNIEDDWEDTILPRFDLAGGNDEMLASVEGVTVEKGDATYDAMCNFEEDMIEIAKIARETPDLGLIVIDPITNYLGSAEMNAEADVRSILTPLAALAAELNIVVLTVGHVNKSEGKDGLQRMMGAGAFTGVARSVYMFGSDPDVPDSPYAHIISPLRGEMGASLKYHTEIVERDCDGMKSKVVRVRWDGKSDATAEDALGEKMSKRENNHTQEAANALKDFLKAGKRTMRDCWEFLRGNGWDLDKLNASRVKKLAGVRFELKDKQSWWYLHTGADTLFEPSPARQKRAEELKKDDAPSY